MRENLTHVVEDYLKTIYNLTAASGALSKLYAATKYKIYEITPDTVQVIKSLSIPEEVLSFYPLAVGNKWVFHHSTITYDPYPNYSYQIDVKEVLGDTIAPNGKYYYKVNDETIWESAVLERIDTTDGKVYRYYEDPTLPDDEYVAYDLVAEVVTKICRDENIFLVC